MKHHVALFKFHLVKGQSIGPAALRTLWSRACESSDISVARQTHGASDRDTYSLCASPRLQNLPVVEARLRRLFSESKLMASLTAVHH